MASLVALVALCTLFVDPDTTAAKPPPGKGGGGGLVGLNVRILDGFSISSDNDDLFDDTYLDGVEFVEAITGDGFRFDTDGTSKIIHKNQVRSVNFDFTNTPDFSSAPAFPDGAMPGVDARIHLETDPFGASLETGRLNLSTMPPNTTAWASFTINFGFVNSDGDTEKWQLAYGRPPGPDGDLPLDYGLPVEVIASDDIDNDGFADSWTILGEYAGLRLLSVGRTSFSAYQGRDFMGFVCDIERQ